MTDKITVCLPHPAKELRPNGRAHWAAKARAVKAARMEARLRVLSALGGEPLEWDPARYDVTWFYKGACPDADNCLAACKAYLDGCCDALGVNDRALDCAGIHRVKDREQEGTVLIRFS